MQIRKAQMEDTPRLNFLLTLLISDEKQYDESINENFVVTDMYENFVNDPKRIMLVAEEDEKIIGYLYGYIIEGDEVETETVAKLDALFVEEDYRKMGAAENLIDHFKVWVINHNISKMVVNVCSANYKAKGLYQKKGFKTTKETMSLEINEYE